MSTTITAPRRRRRGLAIAVIAAGVVAAAPGVATLAGFTAQDVNRDNSILSGTLDVAFGQDAAHFDVRNMKPGDTTEQSVEVRNTGSLVEYYTFDAVNIAGALDDVLLATVKDAKGGTLADGVKLSELEAVKGTLTSGEFTSYSVTFAWPENAPEIDNKYQDAAIGFDFQVDATQTEGKTISNGDNAGN